MAAVDNVTKVEFPIPNMEVVKAQLTATGTSTYVSRFGTIYTCHVNVRGTNTTTKTVSGRTVTITGTNDDWVDIIITGK